MNKEERNNTLRSMEEAIVRCMHSLIQVRDEMEEIRMKSTAKKVNTVVGKLYDLSYEIEKRRNAE